MSERIVLIWLLGLFGVVKLIFIGSLLGGASKSKESGITIAVQILFALLSLVFYWRLAVNL